MLTLCLRSEELAFGGRRRVHRCIVRARGLAGFAPESPSHRGGVGADVSICPPAAGAPCDLAGVVGLDGVRGARLTLPTLDEIQAVRPGQPPGPQVLRRRAIGSVGMAGVQAADAIRDAARAAQPTG
jgi:hypothetical protein